MAAEMHAFSDALDVGYLIRHNLQDLLSHRIPLRMFTNSKRLFDILHSIFNYGAPSYD